jgi:hypothetical protein
MSPRTPPRPRPSPPSVAPDRPRVTNRRVTQQPDQSIYREPAQVGQRPHVNSVANIVVRLLDPIVYVLLCAMLMLVAIGRRRRELAWPSAQSSSVPT